MQQNIDPRQAGIDWGQFREAQREPARGAVASALVLDAMVLGAMIARIGDLGFTPNRTAALGLNLVLLANLAGAAWLAVRFLRRRSVLHPLERWQTTYLPVFTLWAAAVVVLLPPIFAFD
jgi:hypothetical protein